MERLDQMLHAGIHVKVIGQKKPRVREQVSDMVLREHQRGKEFLRVTLEPLSPKLDKRLFILVEEKAALRPIDPKMIQRGAHLRREGKIGRRPPILGSDDPQLIQD